MKPIVKSVLIFISLIISEMSYAYTTDDYDSAMNRRDYKQAIVVMTDLIKKTSPPKADYYYKRAFAYEKTSNYIFAVIDCGTALVYDPTNQEYFLLRSKCKQKINDPTYVQDARNAGDHGMALLEKASKQNVNITSVTSSSPKESVSEVDINIPLTSAKNHNSFVIIFCVENYMESDISDVNFAINDGSKFKEYCIKTLGIPEQNVHLRIDATRNQIRSEIKWASNISDAYGKDANLIVYYSGHGMPDERTRQAYILPADGIANDSESGYPLSSLYEELGKMKFNCSLVLLDACFSGAKRDGEMLTASKGVVIKPSTEELYGNVAVISATHGDDIAYQDDENSHGLFTFYLLKKLKESKGNVTIAELSEYITENVKRASVVRNSKIQQPTVSYSNESTVNLKKFKLKGK